VHKIGVNEWPSYEREIFPSNQKHLMGYSRMGSSLRLLMANLLKFNLFANIQWNIVLYVDQIILYDFELLLE
jgi:hypothetical protein